MSKTIQICERSNRQYFYQRDQLITEVLEQSAHTLLVTAELLIAQLRCDERESASTPLVTDIKRSVLGSCQGRQCKNIAYMPYGFHRPEPGFHDLPAFNGELQDAHTAHYFLGAGYRLYNPLLMRFQSPDSWSPFGQGGANAYAFVQGDPVNQTDPTGHMRKSVMTDRRGSAPNVLPGAALASPGATSKFRRRSVDATVGSRLSVSSSQGPSSRRASSQWSDSSLSLNSTGSDDGRRGWKFSKAGAKFKDSGLSEPEQGKFDTFQNAIHHLGLSPKNAAMLAGNADYKQLDKKTNLFQIRLSQSERVTFTVKNKLVEIRQVGGHT